MLRFLVFVCFYVAAFSAPFITIWNTTLPNETTIWPTFKAQSTVTIDWGDNSTATFVASTNIRNVSHVYTDPGSYSVSVSGEFRLINSSKATKKNLVDIVSWGDGFLIDQTAWALFDGYSNLRVSAPASTQPVFLPGARLIGMFMATSFDSPLNWNLLNVTSIECMFQQTPLNHPISFSNTQALTSVASLFSNATKFNQPVTLDIPNVVYMDSMFALATSFNQPLTLTNTQKVQSTYNMFFRAYAFNQPINFDTRAVIGMSLMFLLATSFNQPLNLDTSSLKDSSQMLLAATSFNQTVNFSSTGQITQMYAMFSQSPQFEQDLSSWDTTSVSSCSDFCPRCGLPAFRNCTPCANYVNYVDRRYTNDKNISVCYSPAPTAVPTPPTTWIPSIAPTPPTSSPSAGGTHSPATSRAPSRAPTAAPSTTAPSMDPEAVSPAAPLTSHAFPWLIALLVVLAPAV